MAAALLLGYQVPWKPSRPKIHERAQARLIVCVIQAAIVYPWGVTAKALAPARKPIERRIYELARKHCGDEQNFKISLSKLHKKIGTTAPIRKLRAQLRQLKETNHLPDYRLSLDADIVTFTNRKDRILEGNTYRPLLMPETFEKARRVAPGWEYLLP